MDEEEGGKTKYLNSNKPNSNIPYNVVGLGDRKKAAIVISFHGIVTMRKVFRFTLGNQLRLFNDPRGPNWRNDYGRRQHLFPIRNSKSINY